jgi:hypothetical protein
VKWREAAQAQSAQTIWAEMTQLGTGAQAHEAQAHGVELARSAHAVEAAQLWTGTQAHGAQAHGRGDQSGARRSAQLARGQACSCAGADGLNMNLLRKNI